MVCVGIVDSLVGAAFILPVGAMIAWAIKPAKAG